MYLKEDSYTQGALKGFGLSRNVVCQPGHVMSTTLVQTELACWFNCRVESSQFEC